MCERLEGAVMEGFEGGSLPLTEKDTSTTRSLIGRSIPLIESRTTHEGLIHTMYAGVTVTFRKPTKREIRIADERLAPLRERLGIELTEEAPVQSRTRKILGKIGIGR